ncbi:MAG: hypothetical protein Q9161_009515 [Pseudevernia consocians]
MPISEAAGVAGAIAGEDIPIEAIANTEIPVSVLKREAASVAKANHVVYGRANAQKAISWDDHVLHASKLPENAAMDWSRATTIARYIGEANSRYDPDFRQYAKLKGVPYQLIMNCWATVSQADYVVHLDDYDLVPRVKVGTIPGGPLANAYGDHEQNLHDAIHRMHNELGNDLIDPKLESLVQIAMHRRGRRGNTKIATGTEVLAEPTKHAFGAQNAAAATAESGTAWAALIDSLRDLTKAQHGVATKLINGAMKLTTFLNKEKKEFKSRKEEMGKFKTFTAENRGLLSKIPRTGNDAQANFRDSFPILTTPMFSHTNMEEPTKEFNA